MRVDLRFKELDLGTQLVGLELGSPEFAFCPCLQKEIGDSYTLNYKESKRYHRLHVLPIIDHEAYGLEMWTGKRLLGFDRPEFPFWRFDLPECGVSFFSRN